MEGAVRSQRATSPTPSPTHRRATSGSSLLSKFPFMKALPERHDNEASKPAPRASASIIQQQKTRRRRGSLRKVALLGRGAQREKKDSKPLTIDTSHAAAFSLDSAVDLTPTQPRAMIQHEPLVLKEPDLTPFPAVDGFETHTGLIDARTGLDDTTAPFPSDTLPPDRDASGSYTSTDEEDILQIPHSSVPTRQGMSLSSGSESYFNGLGAATQRRRSIQQAKSPLSYSGLSTTALPGHDSDWDYSDTSWWGWVVLGVTWFVFVIGMGSCFDIWSWAWDVGKTPYAPPELEDDPTLPIVGYYPALIILTGVMAWVWVVVAWVGMKYFRHAKISGD
ncbi:hypothetical protein G7046_g1568 [Stylonectria norvegica]|nr:hypothetical protein G7046_g1568 [Stylonectria norvegica]